MKAAKPDYYDPKLKGQQDGNDMEQLPKIVPHVSKKSIQKPPTGSSLVYDIRKQASVSTPVKNMPDTPKVSSTPQAGKIDSALASKQLSNSSEKIGDGEPANQLTDQPVQQPTNQSTEQSTRRPISQSTSRSIDRPVDNSALLGRPKAFYITQKQDEDLDTAVAKLNREIGAKVPQKIDRSTLIRLLLEESDITSRETIAKLASRLVNRLISQLTS